MKKIAVVIAAGVLALAGCTAAPEFQATYRSVEQLRDAFEAAGGECPSWQQSNQVKAASESGTCGAGAVLSIYSSAEAAEGSADLLKAISDGHDVHLLVGDNWVINDANVKSLDPAIGGTFVTSNAGTQERAKAEYCKGFVGAAEGYTDVVGDLFNDGSFEPRMWNSVDALLAKQEESDLPPEWQEAHQQWMSLRAQINESVNSDKEATFTSGEWKTGQSFLAEACEAYVD